MIEIPEKLRPKLGPEMKMDVHWVDVRLKSGEILRELVVRGGRYITGRADDPNGEGPLQFSGADIQDIRRHSTRFWPFW
jgi:hypothetical protein